MRPFLLILTCLMTMQLSAKVETKLQYLPDTSVEQEMNVRLEIRQFIGGIELNTQADQLLVSQVTVQNNDGLPVTQPPFDVTFVPKRLKVDVNVNNETISIDSDRPVSSVYMAQISKMIEKAITLHVGEDRLIKADSIDLTKLNRELPLLQEFNMGSFLKEMFQPQFALAGRKLKVGKKYMIKSESLPQVPDVVYFKVTGIDDDKVSAIFQGEVPQKEISLSGQMIFDEKHKENVSLSLKGTIRGKIDWARDNALKHTLQQEYDYQGLIKVGDVEWKMDIHLTVESHQV